MPKKKMKNEKISFCFGEKIQIKSKSQIKYEKLLKPSTSFSSKNFQPDNRFCSIKLPEQKDKRSAGNLGDPFSAVEGGRLEAGARKMFDKRKQISNWKTSEA